VSAKAIEQDRDRIKRFVRASIKGLAYVTAFKDKAVEFTTRYNKRVPGRVLAIEYDSVIAAKTVDGTVPEKFQRQEVEMRAMVIGAKKDRIPPLAKIFDFSMAHEVNRELKAAGWKPVR
jgi:ABC-type nitrate/sulfonate/bicarbonate transport system substrate-binding protein